MAFPYIGSSGFESGSLTNCLTSPGGTASSCTVTGSYLDAAHFSDLARFGMTPYRGTYCMRAKLLGDTNDQCIKELTLMDQASTPVTQYYRWYFYLGNDLVMTDGDKFSMLELESVSNTTTRCAVGIQRTTGNIELWWNNTQAAAGPSVYTLGLITPKVAGTALGRWRYIEVKYICGAAANASIDVYVDSGDAVAATGVSGLTQAAIVDGKLGVIGPDVGTTGTILFDDFIIDDTQIYPDPSRFKDFSWNIIFANDHPLIGPCEFSIAVTGTGTNAILTCYDSDGVPPLATNSIIQIGNVSANEFVPGHEIYKAAKGLYVTLAGTQAKGFIAVDKGGLLSDAQIVTLGRMNGRRRD